MNDYSNWPSPDYVLGGYPERHVKKFRPLKDADGNIREPKYLRYTAGIQSLLGTALEELQMGDCTLTLLGPRGTGKTQAAVQVAYQLDLWQKTQGLCGSHYYTQLGQLFDAEKQSWNTGKELDHMNHEILKPFAKAKEAQLLVIDELQECTNSDWERQMLTRLIDSRYQEEKNTILVGNLTTDGLEGFFSKSINSRLKETGFIIEMAGKKYR